MAPNNIKRTGLEIMQKHYQKRDLAAKNWKEKGGKVVGYMCDSVPDELILAAGFFPLRISGDPWEGTEVIDKYMESACEGFIRSTLNMLLTGKYNFLDFLVIPHTRDNIQIMNSVLNSIKELDPTVKFPEIYSFDRLPFNFYSSSVYNREQVFKFKKILEAWSGKLITKDSLLRAIAIGNESKTLLKKLRDIRAENPPRISGVQALQIISSSMFMLKEDHNKILKEFLDEARELQPRNGVRLFVEGSPLDNLQLYEIIESCNATIISEDNCWGNRHRARTSMSTDPMEAIADRYHFKSLCPFMYPMEAKVKYCVQSALEAKVNGVILNIIECDYAQAWETSDEIKALEAQGIPTLCLNKQPYLLSDNDHAIIKTSVDAFVSRLRYK